MFSVKVLGSPQPAPSSLCHRMTRHGKNCTAGAVYTYHEKKKDTGTVLRPSPSRLVSSSVGVWLLYAHAVWRSAFERPVPAPCVLMMVTIGSVAHLVPPPPSHSWVPALQKERLRAVVPTPGEGSQADLGLSQAPLNLHASLGPSVKGASPSLPSPPPFSDPSGLRLWDPKHSAEPGCCEGLRLLLSLSAALP